MRNAHARRFAFAFPLAVLAAAAHAGSFTLDNPNAVVVRPTSGSATYAFTGTIATGPGEYLYSYGSLAAFDAAGDALLPEANADAFNTLTSPNQTYTGTLFTYTIDASTPLGTYNQIPGIADKPYLDYVYSVGIATTPNPIRIPYSITVQAVPEPMSLAALGLGALAFLCRRRRP